jgi:hypothetical protein
VHSGCASRALLLWIAPGWMTPGRFISERFQ